MAASNTAVQHYVCPTVAEIPADWSHTVVVPNSLWQSAVLERCPDARVLRLHQWLAEQWPKLFAEQALMPDWASGFRCQCMVLQVIDELLYNSPDLTASQQQVLHALNTPEAVRWWLSVWEYAYLAHQPVSAQVAFTGLLAEQKEVLDLLARNYEQMWQNDQTSSSQIPKAMVVRQWLAEGEFPEQVGQECPVAWAGFFYRHEPVVDALLESVGNQPAQPESESGNLQSLTFPVAQYSTQTDECNAVVAGVLKHFQKGVPNTPKQMAIVVPPTLNGQLYGQHIASTLIDRGLSLHPESIGAAEAVASHMPGYDTLGWGLSILLALSAELTTQTRRTVFNDVATAILPDWALQLFPEQSHGLATLTNDDWRRCGQSLIAALANSGPNDTLDSGVSGDVLFTCKPLLETLGQWYQLLANGQYEAWFALWWQRSGAPVDMQDSAMALAAFIWQRSGSPYQVLHGVSASLDELLTHVIRQQHITHPKQSETVVNPNTTVAVLTWPEAAGLHWPHVWMVGLTDALCQSSFSPFTGSGARSCLSLPAQWQACYQSSQNVTVSWFQKNTFSAAHWAETVSEQRLWPWLEARLASDGQESGEALRRDLVSKKEPVAAETNASRGHLWASLPVQAPSPVWATEEPVPLSATGLASYMRCPRQFLYRQWLQLPSDGTPAMVYGRLLHRLLELFHRALALPAPPPYTRTGVEGVWQQWKTMAENNPPIAATADLPEPFSMQDVHTWQQLPVLVQQEMDTLVAQTLTAMDTSGYFADAPSAVVPEVSVSFTDAAWPKVEWIGKIDALFGFARTGQPHLQWDVMDFKHDNPAKWREKTSKSREGKLAKALAPLPETSPEATHAERFSDADGRNYQIPLYYAATQWDEKLKGTLYQLEKNRLAPEHGDNAATTPWIGRVGLQIIRAPIGDADTTGAAKVSCLQVTLPASVLSDAVGPCLKEAHDAVAVPLSQTTELACNVGAHCRQCDYNMVCPEGLAASEYGEDGMGDTRGQEES